MSHLPQKKSKRITALMFAVRSLQTQMLGKDGKGISEANDCPRIQAVIRPKASAKQRDSTTILHIIQNEVIQKSLKRFCRYSPYNKPSTFF